MLGKVNYVLSLETEVHQSTRYLTAIFACVLKIARAAVLFPLKFETSTEVPIQVVHSHMGQSGLE